MAEPRLKALRVSHAWDYIPKSSLGPDRTFQHPQPAATASRTIYRLVNRTCHLITHLLFMRETAAQPIRQPSGRVARRHGCFEYAQSVYTA